MGNGGLMGTIDLVARPECVREARLFVREKLGDAHPAIDDVELLVSELVTNSLVHSDSHNGGQITVVLAMTTTCGLHVIVIDAGSCHVPRVCGDPYGEAGRGLFLVDQLAQRWGVEDDEAGRAVWFEIKHCA